MLRTFVIHTHTLQFKHTSNDIYIYTLYNKYTCTQHDAYIILISDGDQMVVIAASTKQNRSDISRDNRFLDKILFWYYIYSKSMGSV